MLIAHISDLHIKANGRLAYGRVDTAHMLRACIDHIGRLDPAPDLLIATGDLTDHGQAADYALLRELLAPLPMPKLLLAGNHDDRQALRQVFGDQPGLDQDEDFIQYALNIGSLRFVALDTNVPGAGHGELCTRRLRWLDDRLTEDRSPTLVLLHHPPFATGIAHMDQLGLRNPQALEAIVSRHSHVERLLCGHLHRSIQCRFGGTLASTCPSPAHQVALDLRTNAPDCFVMEPPGYQLHLWTQNRLISHTVVLGDYPGPFPFRDDGRLID